MSIPRFLVSRPPSNGRTLSIDDPREVHHALHVLRLKVGDACIAFDGHGYEYHGCLASIDDYRMTLAVEQTVRSDEQQQPHLTLAQALPKLPALEAILRHATELGATRILPLMTARSVARISASRWPIKRARWTRILHEASKQCQRSAIPELVMPLHWERALAHPAMRSGFRVMLTLAASAPRLADVLAQLPAGEATMCVGPEGDFTVEEAEAFQRCGGVLASLGSRVLRTETAALTALAIVQYEWSRQRMTA